MLRVLPAMLVCPKCGSVYTREVDHCGLDGERLLASHEDPLLGRTIDRYRVDAAIGSGGMARVYRAHHKYLEQDFALKILHGEIASDKDLARRFQREAKALSRIKHVNVVNVVDFGTTKEGLLFMVMEFLDGPTLSQVLKDEGPLRARRAADILRQVCLGLDAAHGRGYVHRDLKPGNISLVHEDGLETAKLLDFGLVSIADPSGETVKLTQQGMFFGTPIYMSPEQLRGEQADARSDLYALGIVLYQMLTGTPPFLGDVKELAQQHLNALPARPVLAYSGLTDLALCMLEKDPAKRPASAKAVVERIDNMTIAPRPSPPRTQEPPEAVTRVERSVLAKPVLVEERSFMGQTDDAEPMSESIRAALGMRAYIGGWVPLTAFFLLAAAAGYYFWSGGTMPQIPGFEQIMGSAVAPSSSPVVRPEPSDPPALAPAPAAPAVTPPAKPSPKNPRVAKRPAKRPAAPKPRPAAKPSPPRAKIPSTPVPTPAPPVDDGPVETVEVTDYKTTKTEPAEDPGAPPAKPFSELDMSLGWSLNQKGLAWADLAAVAKRPTRQWERWYKRTSEPDRELLDETFFALMDAVDGMVLNRGLLQTKLARCQELIVQQAGHAGERRYDGLGTRFKALQRDVGFSPLRREAVAISAEISLLETDLKVFVSQAKRRSRTSTTTSG